MENAISGLNFSTGLNFSVGSYNLNKSNARVNYNTQTYDDIPDYNGDIELKENAVQPASEEEKSSVDWAKAVDKGNQKAVIKGWTGVFNLINEIAKLKVNPTLGSGDPTFGNGGIAFLEGFAAFIVAMNAGKNANEAFKDGMSTYVKQWSKKEATSAATNLVTALANRARDTAGTFPEQASADALENIVSKPQIVSLDDLIKAANGGKKALEGISKIGSVASSFGVTGFINIVWNIGFDLINMDGKIEIGTDIYKGSVMTVFSIAGKFFGACFGGKATEAVFTMAGAWVAEVTVNCYETEVGRGCAGVAILVGGAVGCALALALLSNPVGWAVGLCIIAGALVAGVIAWVVEKIVVNRVAVWNFVSDLAVDIWDAGCEFVSDTYEFVADVATTAWNGIKTGAVAAYDFACDAREWIADQASAAWEATTEAVSDAYEWVEEKFDASVEKVENFVSDAGEAVVDYVEDAYEGVKDFAVGAWGLITSW